MNKKIPFPKCNNCGQPLTILITKEEYCYYKPDDQNKTIEKYSRLKYNSDKHENKYFICDNIFCNKFDVKICEEKILTDLNNNDYKIEYNSLDNNIVYIAKKE